MLQIIVVALLVGIDQLVKFLVRENITLYGSRAFLDGFAELTHIRNYGAAWSSFSGMRWMLVFVSSVIAAAIVVILVRRIVTYPMGRWSLTVVLAGALGNLIDRVRVGYVVDMFHFQFIDFPVFNVADMCVVIGGILAGIYFLFYYDKYDGKKGKQNEPV